MGELVSSIVSSLPPLAVFAAAGAWVFSVIKWYDVRNREIRQKRWDDYSKLVSAAWGWKDGDPNNAVGTAEQIIALYRLIEFKEYSFVTAQGLEIAGQSGTPNFMKNVKPSLDDVVAIIKNSPSYSLQSKASRKL